MRKKVNYVDYYESQRDKVCNRRRDTRTRFEKAVDWVYDHRYEMIFCGGLIGGASLAVCANRNWNEKNIGNSDHAKVAYRVADDRIVIGLWVKGALDKKDHFRGGCGLPFLHAKEFAEAILEEIPKEGA